jgi:hypothetical protein
MVVVVVVVVVGWRGVLRGRWASGRWSAFGFCCCRWEASENFFFGLEIFFLEGGMGGRTWKVVAQEPSRGFYCTELVGLFFFFPGLRRC